MILNICLLSSALAEVVVTLRHTSPEAKDELSFDVSDTQGLIATGLVTSGYKDNEVSQKQLATEHVQYTVDRKNVYRELRLCGYQYGKQFQLISKTDLTGTPKFAFK